MFTQGSSNDLVTITRIEKEQIPHLAQTSEFLWVESDYKFHYAMVERHWADLPPLLTRARRIRDLKQKKLEPFAIWRQAVGPQGPVWVWRKLTACRISPEMVLGLCGADFMVRGVVGERNSLICWDDGTSGMEFFVDLDCLIPLCVVNSNSARVCLSIPQQIEWVKTLPAYELGEEELRELSQLTHKTAGDSLVLSARLSIRRFDLLATAGKPVQLWLIAFLGEPTQRQDMRILGRTHPVAGYRPLTWARFVPRGEDHDFIYLKVLGQDGFQKVPFERHKQPKAAKEPKALPPQAHRGQALTMEVSTNLLLAPGDDDFPN